MKVYKLQKTIYNLKIVSLSLVRSVKQSTNIFYISEIAIRSLYFPIKERKLVF